MPGKPKLVPIECEICGNTKLVPSTEVKRGRRFCSKSCASKWRIQNKLCGNIGQSQSGADNPNWKGGKVKHIKGYTLVHCPDHYRAHNGYVMEHIIVAEKMLGRLLWPWEVVHHKNGKKDDNRPENLEVFSCQAEHTKHHYRLRKQGGIR